MNIYGKEATAYYDMHNGLRPAQARQRHPGRDPLREQ